MRTNLGSTQRATLALGSAATVALLGMASPAQAASAHHPDHSDHRSTSLKEGKGHNAAWQAQSDPDGQENGGVDQPGGSGGVDTSHQDGNNGSGNDLDCEDDNRGKGVPGHCKDKTKDKPAKPETPAAPDTSEDSTDQGTDERPEDSEGTGPAPQTPGGPTSSAPTPTSTTVAEGTRPVVLGVERFESTRTAPGRAPASTAPAEHSAGENGAAESGAVERVAAALPNTGAEASTLALFAGGLASVIAGSVLLRRRQAEEA